MCAWHASLPCVRNANAAGYSYCCVVHRPVEHRLCSSFVAIFVALCLQRVLTVTLDILRGCLSYLLQVL
jgi:hypothetical protein